MQDSSHRQDRGNRGRTLWRFRPPRAQAVRAGGFGRRARPRVELEEAPDGEGPESSSEVLRVARRLLGHEGMRANRNGRHHPTCRFCSASLDHTFVDLGMHPPCQKHVEPEMLGAPETFYPLHAWVCHVCFLVQLEEVVPHGLRVQ